MGPERYDLHIHSDYSDSSASIREIVRQANKAELDTIAITDHFWPCIGSRKGGIQLIEQRRQKINGLRNAFPKTKILDGAEVDISSDGSHAQVAGGIDQFELIIGSFHFTLDSTTWRSALQKAVTKWRFDILGHWDGYLTSYREEDGLAVAQLLAEKQIAIEINRRYDTTYPEFLEIARDAGCEFTLGSDAHAVNQVGQIQDQILLAEAMELQLKTFF
ncbi:MAG: PHP domain-containing protein [Candidatus Thorarchaeota archaeon]|jgi:putative hydrolase